MNEGFSVLMFIFSGCLLLYSALLAFTGNYGMLPSRARVSVRPQNPRAYARALAKVIALVALVPFLTGIAAFSSLLLAGFVFAAGMVITLWTGVRIMRKTPPNAGRHS